MSVEEDNELRDLVAQTLETNGVLSKIRAQLRASVFLALEEQSSKENKSPLQNKALKDFLSTSDGKTVVCLIREFLDFFNLEFTQSVYLPETNDTTQYIYEGRHSLTEEMNFDGQADMSSPLLLEVVRRAKLSKNLMSSTRDHPNILSLAEKKFFLLDKDKNGKIDKQAVCDLLSELFPNFKRNMLDCYVNGEFKDSGKKQTDEITFQEFTVLIEKLINMCQNVTAPSSPKQPRSPTLKTSTVKKNEGNGDANSTFILSPKPPPFGDDLRGPIIDVPKQGLGTLSTKATPSLAASTTRNGDSSGADEDSFFDDPPAKPHKSKMDRCTAGGENEGKSGSNTLPALVTVRGAGNRGQESAKDLLDLEREMPKWSPSALDEFDKKLADLEFNNSHDDDYDDDDFQSSDHKSGAEQSISEEIEEDTSAFGDILGSTASGISLPPNDNMTTDKTVSQISGSGIDYIESIAHDSH